jgi:hypothetical protein
VSADIIDLASHRNPGNGAREAMIDLLQDNHISARPLGKWDCPAVADYILALLWERGFKVVPLDDKDQYS